ncbi:Hypothetical predicted protein [Olea europaea subsp. europaea]|uniref:Uncharacterized protein n=1 Tax=Olea europaea subsp. europaea TaxID=158383 RepID=A0A8S0T451_OLEEU|nr:Hypothetical predicted protein [Olea europaea subsp. europaea]
MVVEVVTIALKQAKDMTAAAQAHFKERLFEIIDDHPTVVKVVARALKQAKDMAAAVQDNHIARTNRGRVCLNPSSRGLKSLQ